MLENVSTEDLRHALAEREAQEQAAREAEADRKRSVVVRNVEVFLELVATHGRTSCSDAEPVNASRARCTRCVLLHARAHGYLPDELTVEGEPLFRYDSRFDG